MKQVALPLAVLMFIAGCGEKSIIAPLYPISGTVTMNGKPVPGAGLKFYPAVKSGPEEVMGTAVADESGKYELQPGMAVGEHAVTVVQVLDKSGKPITKFEEGMDIEQLMMAGQVRQGLPKKYGDPAESPLKVVVKADGENVYNIEMK